MNTFSKLTKGFQEYKIPILRFTLLILGLLLLMISKAQTGNVCETPIQITTLPYSHSGVTGTYGNDYDYNDVPPPIENVISNGSFATNYLGASEVVYAYTASQDDYMDAFLLGNGDLSALWVFTGCPFEATVGWDLFYNNEEREVKSIPVMAGETYYFVLSSYPNNPSYAYTFELHESPDFDCPEFLDFIGNPCDDSVVLTINDVITADCECEGTSIEATGVFWLPESLECGFRQVGVRFYEPGTDNLIVSRSSYSADNSATFQVSEMPVGSYDLYIDIDGMLRQKLSNHNTTTGSNTIYLDDTVTGDLNDNNSINISDVSIFASCFGTTINSSNYNPLANLNCDFSINILDLSLLGLNFGLQGVSNP